MEHNQMCTGYVTDAQSEYACAYCDEASILQF
jgi:hypothetical protein